MTIEEWFHSQLPAEWFTEPADVAVDDDEIMILGRLGESDQPGPAEAPAARFRAETRGQRIEIAAQAEEMYGRKVSWGVQVRDERFLFTSVAIPVMTRLRMAERDVIDTLVSAGVARSRSEALAWCVAQIGRQQGEWLDSLKQALTEVARVKDDGPR